MNDTNIMMIIFGVVVFYVIEYWIIRSACGAATRQRRQAVEIKLLALIAEKLGVDTEEVAILVNKSKITDEL